MGDNEAFDFFTEEIEHALALRPKDFEQDEYHLLDARSGVVMWIGSGEDSLVIGKWPYVDSAIKRGAAGVRIPPSFRIRIWKAYLRWKDRWTKGGSYDNNQYVIRSAMSLRMANRPDKSEKI